MGQLLKDEGFIDLLKTRLRTMQLLRTDIQVKGYGLKRGPWDHIKEAGLLSAEGLRDEYIKVLEKTSKLPSTDRNWVKVIVEAELVRTIRHHNLRSEQHE
jgi:hypothetical protein